jgi:predicted AAA+ superfamily ATPase
MLSLKSNDKSKKPICIIKSDKKKTGEVFLYDKINKNEDGFDEMELKDNFTFQLIPNKNNQRDVLYIAGASGSGKSYYCKEYLKEYISLFPNNPIYLFSYLDLDETIDEVKKIKRFYK